MLPNIARLASPVVLRAISDVQRTIIPSPSAEDYVMSSIENRLMLVSSLAGVSRQAASAKSTTSPLAAAALIDKAPFAVAKPKGLAGS